MKLLVIAIQGRIQQRWIGRERGWCHSPDGIPKCEFAIPTALCLFSKGTLRWVEDVVMSQFPLFRCEQPY